MRFTDPSALPIPDPEDVGATALFLQAFARRTEEALASQYDTLGLALNPPMFIVNNASVVNSGAAVSILDLGTFVNTSNDIYRSNNGTAGDRVFMRTGLWQVGFTISASVTGTVNNNTHRRGRLSIQLNDPVSGLSSETEDLSYTHTEKNVGSATSVSAEKLIYVPPDSARSSGGNYGRFALYFNHGNTSSTMQIAAGGAKVWGFWISDDELIRSA